MAITNIKGAPVAATNSGSTVATATIAGVAGSINYITDIDCSSDLAGAIMTAKQGTTVVWEKILGANTSGAYRFESPIPSAAGASISVTINGTSLCKANIAGYQL